MVDNTGSELPTDNPQELQSVEEPENHVEYMTLTPDWPNLLRWHLHAMKTDSFDGSEGRRAALHSIVDITRYMAHKEPAELLVILKEFEEGPARHDHAPDEALRHENCPGCIAASRGKPHEFGLPVTVITADGTGEGRLMPDDSIAMDTQRCGCPVEYHLADCPLRFSGGEDDHLEQDFEDRFVEPELD